MRRAACRRACSRSPRAWSPSSTRSQDEDREGPDTELTDLQDVDGDGVAALVPRQSGSDVPLRTLKNLPYTLHATFAHATI